MNDSLIVHTSDIKVQHNPNTLIARWHEGMSVGVAEKPQNDWSGYEICERTWFTKYQHRPNFRIF